MSNIVGNFGIAEPLDDYVNNQIRVRQEKKGSGVGSEVKTPEEISYLTSQNAWIRCASSSKVYQSRLLKMGFDQKQAEKMQGQNLAKKFVLFNGITDNDNFGLQRGGYSQTDDRLSDALYGVGGLDFGQVPMPGIKSFNVSHLNNGAIREANLQIIAHNQIQYNIIETLYVRLGYTIFFEWGNNMYFDNSNTPEFITNSPSTLIEDGTWFDGQVEGDNAFLYYASKIDEKRKEFAGNYDAFLGRVTNYNVSFTPEGTYIVTISAISTGNVIESISMNSLTTANTIKTTDNPDIEKAAEDNYFDLSNFLNVCKYEEQYNTPNEVTGFIDYVDLSQQENLLIQIDRLDLQYIRLGTLLKFIEEKIVPYNGDTPIITIDEASTSYMGIFKNLVSTNPNFCVIRNDSLLNNYDLDHNKMFESFTNIQNPENENEGVIGNIYINISSLLDLSLQLNNDDSSKSVTLFDFLDKICDNINACFGGFIQIQPSIFGDNVVILRDINYVNPQRSDEDQEEFIVYGINEGGRKASILRTYDLKTEISPDLSSFLAIGAAASNLSNAYINPFFESLHQGVEDIYQNGEVTDGKKEVDNPTSKTFDTKTQGTSKKITSNQPQVQQGIDNNEESQSENQLKKEATKKSLEEKEKAKNNYFEYLNEMFGIPKLSPKNIYFQIQKQDIKRGGSALALYIRSVDNLINKREKQKGKPGGAITNQFIPITLNFQLDGLSGVNIYNILKIDTSFLPIPYPDSIRFIVRSVSHQVEDNDWITTLDALSIPKATPEQRNERFVLYNDDKPSSIQSSANLNDAQSESSFTEEGEETTDGVLTLFAPTGDLPFNIRNDQGGSGVFGSNRAGGRKHGGIDIVTQVPNADDIDIFKEYPLLKGRKSVYREYINSNNIAVRTLSRQVLNGLDPTSGRGTTIFAPIEGRLVPTTAFKDSVLPGAKIYGTGKYLGYIVFIFYFAYDKNLVGRNVKMGQPIGNAVDMSIQPGYEEAGVTDHIHFEIRNKKGLKLKKLDPRDKSKFKYTITP